METYHKVALRKPSHLFQEEKNSTMEDGNSVVETFNETFYKFKGNLDIVQNLNNKVNFLTKEIGNKITKSDLDNAMFSHLMMVDESIKTLDAKVKGLNKNDLLEFKRTSAHLVELVEELTENEFPKYKKKIVNTEVKISEKLNDFKEEVIYTQEVAENNLQEKLENFAEVVDNNFSIFNENIQQTKTYVNETVNTYKKLSKILESKVEKENERLDEYSVVLENFNNEFLKFQENIQEQIEQYETINSVLDERFEYFGNELNEWKSSAESDLKQFKNQTNNIVEEYRENITSLNTDIVVYENHNKTLKNKLEVVEEYIQKNHKEIEELKEEVFNEIVVYENHNKTLKNNLEVVEEYIQKNHKEIEELKEEVFNEIKTLPLGNIQENIQRLESKIDFIRETYSKIEPEIILKEVIKEGLAEPASKNNKDPLSSLDKKFVTLDQLQEHYRLFLNRIQQQLSTLGGGGETRLKYLDDIVGIATNSSAYDGNYLKYNHSLGKFEFDSVDITALNGSQITSGTIPGDRGVTSGSTSSSFVEYNGITKTAGQFDGGITDPSNTTRLNYDGYFYATRFYGDSAIFGSNVTINSTGINASGIVTATNFNSTSDAKLKTNIQTIKNPLEKVNQLDGVTFNWIADNRPSMGVIADEVEKILPELVSNTDPKTVNYNGLIGLLIECIKTQQNVSGISTFASDLDINASVNISNDLNVSGVSTFASDLDIAGSVSSNLVVSGFSSVTDTRLNSISEESSIGVGNTINLVYNTGGGNIGIITSPSGPIELNVTGIPTDSSFDNRVLKFSVMVNQGVSVSYACSSITLNGVTPTIKWTGGVVAVGSTDSYDVFNFTCINPVGSASSTVNYIVFGVLNGNFK